MCRKLHCAIVIEKYKKEAIHGWNFFFRNFLLCSVVISSYLKHQQESVRKVYIPPDLVALFHNTNILVKAIILLFTQISTVLCKIVQVWPVWLTFVSRVGRNSSIAFEFPSRISHFSLQWIPRKFISTDFSDCKADSSASLSSSSNIRSFMNSLI